MTMVSHSIDIYTVVIKNIKTMHVLSTNQIADILHYNDNCQYHSVIINYQLL